MIDSLLNILIWFSENPIESTILLFIEYIAVMEAYAKAMGTKWAKPVKYTLGVFFLPQDWLVNVFAMSLFMLDKPGSTLEVVTGRMKRYQVIYGGHRSSLNPLEKWRYEFAKRLCRHLNRFDPTGKHC